MISSKINPFSLPSVLLQNKDLLPARGAVYFVIDANEILYIGQTKNLYNRWRSHHKQPEISDSNQILIAWLECDEPQRTPLELELIKLHKPRLNGVRTDKQPVSFVLPEFLATQIKALADQEQRSVNDLLLSLITRGLLAHLQDIEILDKLKSRLIFENQSRNNDLDS